MATRSHMTLLNKTWDADYRAFLIDSRPVVNSGIVGGRRSAFVPALHAIIRGLEEHRRAAPQTTRVVGADMLLVNWVAVVAEQRQTGGNSADRGDSPRGGVVRGYPFGPVNWPMWAKLPPASGSLCPPHVAPAGHAHGTSKQQRSPCNSQCAYEWFNATLVTSGIASYWFGHKLPRSWLNRIRLHACYPAEAATARAERALSRAGAGKFYCECQTVGNSSTRRGSLLRS